MRSRFFCFKICYSNFTLKVWRQWFVVLNGYEINLSDVGRSDLQAAAGEESFYFLLNDASIGDGENGMSGFLPKDQKELLDSENAYAPIYK